MFTKQVAAFGQRLSRVGRPIIMKLNPKEIEDLSPEEFAAVDQIYSEQAKTNDCTSLEMYDEKAQAIFAAWESDALGGTDPAIPFSRGAQIRAEVQSAMQRGATVVVRRRFIEATAGNAMVYCITAFLAAAVGVGLTTDKIDALRTTQSTQVTDTLTIVKDCTAAQAGKVTNPTITRKLPTACFDNGSVGE